MVSKMKLLSSIITVTAILAMTTVSVLAYSFGYSAMPSSTQTAINNAYNNYYMPNNSGTEYLSLTEFRNACTAFSSYSSPSWTSTSNWAYTSLADKSEFNSYYNNTSGAYTSILARAIYAECSNLTSRQANMHAVAEVIMNRARVNYLNKGYDCGSQVLAAGQFSCMRDGNIGATNPVYYTSDISNWSYALSLATHMESYREPLGYEQLTTNYYNFYDISDSMPFYIYSNGTYTKCTSSNVTSANRYKVGTTYYTITASPKKIGTHVYFSY